MELQDKDLKELFAPLSFDKAKDLEDDSADWLLMEKQLQRQNFFSFGFRHINIYNTSAIILFIAICIGFYSISKQKTIEQTITQPKENRLLKVEPIDQKENKVSEPTKIESQIIEKNTVEITHEVKSHSKEFKCRTITTEVNVSKQSTVNPTIETTKKNDVNEVQVVTTVAKQAEKASIKTQNVVYKRTVDTVIQYDTINRKAKKRKGLFSK